jgi:hypothetical protein
VKPESLSAEHRARGVELAQGGPLLVAVLLAVAWIACHSAPEPRVVPEGEEFGAGLTLEEVTSLGEVVARPEAWADRTVLVEGQVRDVCQRRGCWMVIRDAQAEARVDFLDYGFFVPKEAAGRHAYVEGRVRRETLSEETARHYAEESAEGDPSRIRGPQQVVSLTATGVRLLSRE